MWSAYLIKPEGMCLADPIRRAILQSGLVIVRSRVIQFPKWGVDFLYPGLPPAIEEATRKHLVGQGCEMGMVWGFDAIRRLVNVCGESTDPQKCAPGTIRRDYAGMSPPLLLTDGQSYFPNLIHRPRSEAEVVTLAMLYRQCPRP